MAKIVKVGIIGAGLMGHRRAEAIRAVGGSRLIAVTDVDQKKAKDLANHYRVEADRDWRTLLRRKDIDAVIISVPNKFLLPIAIEALKLGKHVLCEKPFGRNSQEAKKMILASKKSHRIIRVGFNHRFHAAVVMAKKIINAGKIGDPMFIRSRYGQGGRKGMEKEWRFNRNISGGGELLDQGVHLIDLCRFFAGDFHDVFGIADSKFWKSNVEDNAFVILKNKKVTASFHASATQWKNLFSFEIYGTRGFLEISGKGGSYGPEALIFGVRPKEFGIPQIKIFKFEKDESWENEWHSFLDTLKNKKSLIASPLDGYEANRIVEAVYRSSRVKKVVRI